jgi:glutamate 5-kinase
MRQREVSLKIARHAMNAATNNSSPLTHARRIVVKVGSALLVDQSTGQVNRPWLETLVDDLIRLRARKQEVVLVSSGAIALGRRELNLPRGALALPQSQAAAAVGQISLAHVYKELLASAGITVAQILLTLEDSEHRRRYLNARATLSELLQLGTLPVINENDTVATAEIRYGDNDRLAARVAQMTSADCLLLLSDVSGLYTADPNLDAGARLIPEVREITPEIEAMGGASASSVGSGGMATKIAAAKIATSAGCAMAIAAGAPLHPVRRLEEGAECSWFLPASNPENARKQWIAGSLRPSGSVRIDEGAARALRSGKSLLPAGVVSVSGRFARGDTVSVLDREGVEIARGMIAYNDQDAARLVGKRSADIEALLGFRGRDEMIHRDDLVLMRADLVAAG